MLQLLPINNYIHVYARRASGITDSSLKYHLMNAKKNGVTKEEIAAIITHATMYCGWPKGWAVFRLVAEVWSGESGKEPLSRETYEENCMFPVGDLNTAFNKWFTGQSYLYPVLKERLGIYNVTFEPGCRNFWHVHHAKERGGQILVCVGGRGFYQEWGKEAVPMKPGDCVEIPPEVKHWHGAASDSWFSHLSIEVPGVETSNEWLEPVSEEQYQAVQ